jgi:hypothetical protein
MSVLGDIMTGLRTVMELTGKVESLTKEIDELALSVRDIDRRLVRVETVIEITRTDGATLRIAKGDAP